ncbi:MAG: hypothetical protein L0Z55_05090 [Planctomycetes bacterium]|nr:hypothetical protein [Planctomycetota bacterium]
MLQTRTACRAVLLVSILGIIQAGCERASDGQGAYDLRGPGPRVGMRIRTDAKFKMNELAASATAGQGRMVNGKMSAIVRNTEDHEILSVIARDVTRYTQAILLDLTEHESEFAGKVANEAKHGSLEGHVVQHEWRQGAWSKTLAAGNATPDQKKELANLQSWQSEDDIYPAEPVKPGHSWHVDSGHLMRYFGHEFLSISGECSMTFMRIESHDKEDCALISSTFQFTGKMLDDDNNELEIEAGGTMDALRSLATGLDVLTTGRGQVKIRGSMALFAAPVAFEARGPFTVETTASAR